MVHIKKNLKETKNHPKMARLWAEGTAVDGPVLVSGLMEFKTH